MNKGIKKNDTDDMHIDPSEIEKADEDEKELSAYKEKSISVYDPYKKYISEIRKIPVLSREEEHRLARLYSESGDKDAAYMLVISNLRLVVKIAMEFQRKWMKNLSDLIQEGNIGLMEAIKRYDPYRNVRFSSYSSYWIRAYIIKFIMENYSLIKIGKTQAQRKLFFRLNKEKRKLEQLGYKVGPKLLSEKLQVKEKDIMEMEIRLNSPVLSLDEPIKDDASASHIDSMTYGDDEAIDEKLAREQMNQLIKDKLKQFKKGLNDKERFIFENRIYSETPMNLRELGEALNFSRERARQVESNILKKLKTHLKEYMSDINIP